MTVIYDALSVLRAKLEVETGQFSIRNMLRSIDVQTQTEIWVWDGAGAKSVRQKIYPEYKTQRQPMKESISEGLKLIRQLMMHTNSVQITIPGFEADDVIAQLAKLYSQSGDPAHIQTRDRDLRMLTQYKGITVSAEPGKVPDHHLHLYKTFVGDPSDNVKGVPGFGHKSWEATTPQILSNIIDNLNRGVGVSYSELKEFMPKKSAEWLCNNGKQLLAMHAVTSFLPVPEDLLLRHMQIATTNLTEREGLLQQWML
jgi:5'-3' exonuclease